MFVSCQFVFYSDSLLSTFRLIYFMDTIYLISLPITISLHFPAELNSVFSIPFHHQSWGLHIFCTPQRTQKLELAGISRDNACHLWLNVDLIRSTTEYSNELLISGHLRTRHPWPWAGVAPQNRNTPSAHIKKVELRSRW